VLTLIRERLRVVEAKSMSLRKGYQLTPFGRWSNRKAKDERYRERLTVEELTDYVLLLKRSAKSLSFCNNTNAQR